MPLKDPEEHRAYVRAYSRVRHATNLEVRLYKKAYNKIYETTPKRRAQKNATRKIWRAKRRALGLPAS